MNLKNPFDSIFLNCSVPLISYFLINVITVVRETFQVELKGKKRQK